MNKTESAEHIGPVSSGEFMVPALETAVAVRDTETSAATAAAVAEIQASYLVAIRNPRNIEAVRVRMMDACKRPGFRAAARYSVPRGTGKVKGWTIRAAEEFIRDMGNLRVSTATSFETETERKVRIQVTDLETNASFGREVTIQKTVERKGEIVLKKRAADIISQRQNSYDETVYILRATEEEVATKEASAVSKVIRNEGLRLIPGDLLEEALAILETSKGNTAPAAKEEARKIIDAFNADCGVKVQDIEKYLGCPVAQVTVEDVADLREVYTAITKEGQRWGDFLDARLAEQSTPNSSGEGTPKAPRTRRTKRQILAEKAEGMDITVKDSWTALDLEKAIECKEAELAEAEKNQGGGEAPADGSKQNSFLT